MGGGGWRKVYVSKRPHLHEFLQAVSKEFEVVVFTAARAAFARAVVNEIDPRGEMIDHVLSRESCTRLSLSKRKRAAVVKDLGIIGRPLSKVRRVCMDWCSFAPRHYYYVFRTDCSTSYSVLVEMTSVCGELLVDAPVSHRYTVL